MKHVFTLLAIALMSSASAQVSNHVSEDGLRYWSDFDGSVVDQSVPQTSTSLSGALPTEDRNGTAAGAMFFDGVDDHVELFAVEGGVTFEDELTVAAWMKAEEFLGGHHPRLFHSSEGVGGGFDRWFFTWSPASAGSVVGFGVGNGQNSTVGVDSQNSVTPGEWHHVAAIFQSGMVKVLVDGVLESEAPLAFTSLNHIDAPVFLGSALGNSHFNGALDEVGIWDRALNVEEVLDLYLMSSGDAQLPDDVPSDGLVAFYELENSLLDLGEGESHGSSESVQFSCETEDDGFCSLVLTEESSYVNLPSSLELNGTQGGVSMGGWVKLESMETSDWKLILDVTDGTANNNWGDRIQMGVMQDESGLFWNSGAHFDNDITVDYLLDTPWDIEFGRWYHFMVTYDFDGSLTHYIDGVPVNDTDVSNVGDCFLAGGNNGSRRIGARAHNQNADLKWEGGLRSIGIWERPLAPSEVEMMFQQSSFHLIGCTDPAACNFMPAATEDDGSCVMQPQEIWQGEQLFSLEEELAVAVSGVDHVIWSDNMTENPLTVVESGTYGVTMVNGDLNEMSQSVSTGPGSCGVIEAGSDWKADQFTVGLWLKLDNANRGYILMEGDDGWLDDFGLALQCIDGFIELDVNHLNLGLTSVNLNDGNWHAVHVMYNGSAIQLYIDGALNMDVPFEDTIEQNDWPIVLGSKKSYECTTDDGSGSVFEGSLSRLSIWSRTLEPWELMESITCGERFVGESLVGHWPLDGSGASDELVALAGEAGVNHDMAAVEDSPVGSCSRCATSDWVEVVLATDLCGEGTVWDASAMTCVVANPSDTDFDGCVSMTDLLDLLTVFGTCADQPSDDTNELPAVEDALYVMDNSIFNQAQEFTIAARAAFNGAESYSIIYQQIEGGEMKLSHYDGVLNFQVKASNGNCYTASGWVYAQTALADEDLHHIVATYDRTEGEISLSIDGEVRVIQSVNDGDLADCDHYEATIGNESVQDWRLAEIGFYQFAWTADQIEAYSACVDLVDLDFNAPTVLLPIGTSPDGAAEVLESYEPLQILGSPGVVTCE